MTARFSREAIASLLIGIVVIAGIGLTGATLDSTEQVGGPNETQVFQEPDETAEPGQPGRNPDDPGDMNLTRTGADDGSDEPLSRCIEVLDSMPGTLAVVLGFFLIVGFVFRRYSFSVALLVGWTVLPPVLLAYFLLTNCGEGPTESGGSGPALPGGGTALDVSPNVPPWAMLGLAGLILLGAVGLMYRTMGEEEVVTIDEETDEEADLDEFAEAAGRAADRIEEHDVDVDNAVYRAWVEMTDLIDVDNPDSYSPGEFADVAIDLGMAEPDVTELTTLFNEVRYGDKEAETREDRALSVLRSIESQYGTDDERGGVNAADVDERSGDPDDLGNDADESVADTDDRVADADERSGADDADEDGAGGTDQGHTNAEGTDTTDADGDDEV